jgi:hypothetical protein
MTQSTTLEVMFGGRSDNRFRMAMEYFSVFKMSIRFVGDELALSELKSNLSIFR